MVNWTRTRSGVLTGWILVLMSSSTTLRLRQAMSQSATLPIAASSSPLLLRTSARGGRTTRGRARSRPGDPAPAVAGPRRKPVSARAEIRTPRAWDPRAVDSERVVLQRCWSGRLGLGPRDFPVVSRDDADPVSYHRRGVFCEIYVVETGSRDPLRACSVSICGSSTLFLV